METLPKTNLQIFYKIILNFQIIVEFIVDPDDRISKVSESLMGYKL